MESRILMEVEEMVNKVREEQGRPFDMEQLITSCVANVVMNMMFGHRFDHADPDFQQLLFDLLEWISDASLLLELFPVLRFLPYFKTKVAKNLRCQRDVLNFINTYTATCIEVSLTVFVA